MNNKSIKNIRIIIITISLIVFLLVLKDVFDYEVTSYDNWAYEVFVEDLRSDNMTIIMKLITSLGGAIVIGTIVVFLYLLCKNKRNSYLALVSLVTIFLINNFLKFLVHRPRPSGYNLIEESYYSFPSGHSMVSTAFYGFMIYLIYKNIKNKNLKWFLISLIFLSIILICISRIYLGVHYLSDTIAGFAISIAYIMLFITIVEKYNLLGDDKNVQQKRRKKGKKA